MQDVESSKGAGELSRSSLDTGAKSKIKPKKKPWDKPEPFFNFLTDVHFLKPGQISVPTLCSKPGRLATLNLDSG